MENLNLEEINNKHHISLGECDQDIDIWLVLLSIFIHF